MRQMHSEIGTLEADNLISGNEVTKQVKGVTIKKNQGLLLRGTVLGKISNTGLCITVDSSKSDGSEEAYCILCDDFNTELETTSAGHKVSAYFAGVFNPDRVIFGGTDTYEDHEARLREKNIVFKEMK